MALSFSILMCCLAIKEVRCGARGSIVLAVRPIWHVLYRRFRDMCIQFRTRACM